MIRCRTRYDRLAERIIQFGTLVGIKWIHGILQACKYTLFSAQEYEMALRELSFMIKQPEGQVKHLQKCIEQMDTVVLHVRLGFHYKSNIKNGKQWRL